MNPPILARASFAAPDTALGEFMFMPSGTHTIYCLHAGKNIEAQIEVDRSAAVAMQQQFVAVKSRSAHLPFFDFDHDDKSASFWPASFAWRDSPAPGIYAAGEWTAAGKAAIEGKSYRAFSPVFHVDDVKKKPARLVCNANAPLNFGGLVNNPAFRKISPIWGKHAGKPGAAISTQTTPPMTDTEKAALEAQIQQTNTRIVELRAQDQSAAEVAEALLGAEGQLTLMNAQLAAKIAEDRNAVLERENLINRTQKAQAAVAAKVKSGAIPTKAIALQAAWVEKLVEDPSTQKLLEGMPDSPALSGTGIGDPQTRIAGRHSLVGITRESSSAVLGRMSTLMDRQIKGMPYHDKPLLGREIGELYIDEIKPRLAAGDDIPLKAVDTLAQTLVIIRQLENLQLTFPLLTSIWTDFKDSIVSYLDTATSRFIGIPAVQTYNSSTGWPTQSTAAATDVPITYNQFKGVPIRFAGHVIAGTVRRLFDEVKSNQLYALGKDMVDYVYSLITGAYTQQTAAGLGTFGRSTVIDLAGILDDAGVPDIGRFLILNRPYYSAISKDSAIIQLDTFQQLMVIQKGLELSQLRQVEGFQLIKAINLPNTAIAGGFLKGFGGSQSSLAIASRLSADYVNANPGASNGILTVVTLPGGPSANLVQFVDHNGAYAAQRVEMIYGAGRGQLNAGVVLRDV